MIDNMTNAQQFWLFGFMALTLIAGVLDAYTTQIGFDEGLTEANPVSKWLIGKVGLAASTFIALTFFIVATLALSKVSGLGSIIGAAVVGGVEVFNVIRNHSLDKKYKKK